MARAVLECCGVPYDLVIFINRAKKVTEPDVLRSDCVMFLQIEPTECQM